MSELRAEERNLVMPVTPIINPLNPGSCDKGMSTLKDMSVAKGLVLLPVAMELVLVQSCAYTK